MEIKYTLVSEGTSDQALIPILNWILRQRSDLAVNGVWADPHNMLSGTKGLAARIRWAMDFLPCGVLFVHRDSDTETPEKRRSEIEAAIASFKGSAPPYICVVPVKTTEAWLLFDEQAIREFAGNPDGRETLSLPKLNRLEALGEPKAKLQQAFETASRSKGRRKKTYDNADSLISLALNIETFALLRALSAFQRLEADIYTCLEKMAANADSG